MRISKDSLKHHWLLPVSMLLLTAAAAMANPRDKGVFIQPGCELVFADVETGQEIIAEKDMFTNALGPWIKAATLKTTDPVTTDQYLDHLKSQVQPWNELEKEMVRWAANELYPKLAPYHLRLPEKIVLIKTTGKDMQGAAYCRRESIVFPEAMIFPLGPQFKSLLTHELFHVYSRYNLDWRDDLYAVLDFKPCNEMDLPPTIADRLVTNPDAPLNNYYVEIPYEDQTLPVMPLVLAHQPYDPNAADLGLAAAADIKLLVLTREGDRWLPQLEEGRPRLLNMIDAMGFFKIVGQNTHYNWGVEEILAENFTLIILDKKNNPSPQIIEKLKTFLKEHEAEKNQPDTIPYRRSSGVANRIHFQTSPLPAYDSSMNESEKPSFRAKYCHPGSASGARNLFRRYANHCV